MTVKVELLFAIALLAVLRYAAHDRQLLGAILRDHFVVSRRVLLADVDRVAVHVLRDVDILGTMLFECH